MQLLMYITRNKRTQKDYSEVGVIPSIFSKLEIY